MKAPESLETLVEYGVIQQVLRPLMSGKEAQVYVVTAGGQECVAKVYKEANQRTFKHRSDYTEGRRTRNTRDQRAMAKRTRHGRKKDEDAWRSTEVDMIYRLRDAGVRVPEPLNFVEGVLVMELVKDAAGQAAPRLGDLTFSPDEAREIYQQLIREVVRMLCAGVIHGDLSEFNVLMSHDGPVVIDFPQSVDPTHNPNSQKLLLRDVENLHRFLARFAPDDRVLPYGEEIWSLFQANRLEPDTKLGGRYQAPKGKADITEVMALVEDAHRDEQRRRAGGRSAEDDEGEESPGVFSKAPPPFRRVVDVSGEMKKRPSRRDRRGQNREAAPARARREPGERAVPPAGPAADSRGANENRPSRPRGRRGGQGRPDSARETGDPTRRSEITKDDAAKPAGSRRRRRSRRPPAGGSAASASNPSRGQSEPSTRTQEPGASARGSEGAAQETRRTRGGSKSSVPSSSASSSRGGGPSGEGREGNRPGRRRRRSRRKPTPTD